MEIYKKGGKCFQNLLDIRWVMDQRSIFDMICSVEIVH